MQVWIKADACNDFVGLVHYYNGANDYVMFVLTNNDHPGMIGKIYSASESGSDSSFDVCDGTWHLISYVYDDPNIKIYVDGTDVTGGGISTYGTGTTQGLWIGIRNDLNSDFTGYLDEVVG